MADATVMLPVTMRMDGVGKDENARERTGTTIEGLIYREEGATSTLKGLLLQNPMPNGTFGDIVKLVLPCGPKNISYDSSSNSGDNLVFSTACAPCCPWGVSKNGARVATAAPAGCCTNGAMFFMCPLLVCSGKAKWLMINDNQGQEMFTVQQKLSPCWPFAAGLASCAAPCGMVLASMFSCLQVIKGNMGQELRQPIFRALPDPTAESEQVGEIVVTKLNLPNSACTAAPIQTVKVEFVASADFKPSEKERTGIALLVMMYKGQKFKDCGMPSTPPFPVPMGSSCTDMGLLSTNAYMPLKDIAARMQ